MNNYKKILCRCLDGIVFLPEKVYDVLGSAVTPVNLILKGHT